MIRITKITIASLVVLFALLLFIGLVFLRFNIREKETNTTPEIESSKTLPQITQTSPVKRTVIGVTTEEEVKKRYQIISSTSNNKGGIDHRINSIWKSRPNIIETTSGIVSFERALAPLNPNEPGFSKISTYLSSLGEPEERINGSLYYGPFASVYVYASKGVSFVGNPNTDEIYEFQYFNPISVDEYKKVYGQDIDPNPQQHRFDPNN